MLKHTSTIKTSFLVASLGAIPLFTYAASDTWDGDTDALWSDATNWVTAGAVPGTGDTATFNAAAGTGGATIDLGAGVTITNITFDTASVAAYTIGAGGVGVDTLTLDSGGAITVNSGVTNDQTINADVVHGGGTVILTNNSAANDLIIAGAITTVTDTAGQTLRTLGTGTTTLNNITDNTSGLFSLDVRNDTTLNGAITNSNGGTQRTVVRNGGTLGVTSTGSLDASSDLLIYDGEVTLNNSTAQTVNVLTFGHGTAGNGDSTLNIASGAAIASATHAINYLDDNGVANVALITGAGTVNISANTTVTVDNNSSIAATDAELTIASDFSGTGGHDLFKAGNGTLRLTGTNDTSGLNRIRINAGVLQIEQDSNLGDNSVRISSGGTAAVLEYVGAGGVIGASIRHHGTAGSTNATIRANGTGAVEFNNFSAAGTGTILTLDGSSTALNLISDDLNDFDGLGGGLTKAGTGTWVLSTDQTYTGTTTITDGILQIGNGGTTGTLGANTGAIANDGTLAIDRSDAYTVANVISGGGAVNQLGAGTTTLTGTNTYTGVTTISAGTLQLGDGTSGNDGTIAGDIVNNSNLTFNVFGSESYTSALSGTGDLSKLGAGTQTIDGTYVLSAATNINVASNGDSAPELTITSDIGASGNRDITKTGSGTLLLTGDNSAGVVGSLTDTDDDGINRLRIDEGVVQIQQANNLGDNSIFMSDAGTTVGVLEFVGSSAATIENQIALRGNSGTNHILRANGATSAATVEYTQANTGGNGDTLTLDGSNTGLNTIGFDLNANGNGLAGGLTKDGTGTWVLSVDQTYTGTTTVSAGTLIINADSSGATGAVTVASGATLGGSGTIGGDTTISAGGFLNPGNSPGLLTFDGALTLAGTTTMEIAGAVRGTSFDAIDVGGLLTYGGALVITSDTTIAAGTYDLFGINGSLAGDFTSIILSGLAYSDDALTNSGGVWTALLSGITYTFTQSTGDLVVVVPEPGTFALIAGMFALTSIAMRRRNRG